MASSDATAAARIAESLEYCQSFPQLLGRMILLSCSAKQHLLGPVDSYGREENDVTIKSPHERDNRCDSWRFHPVDLRRWTMTPSGVVDRRRICREVNEKFVTYLYRLDLRRLCD